MLNIGIQALHAGPANLKIFMGPSFLVCHSQAIENREELRDCRWIRKIDECVAQIIATAKIKWGIEKVESTGETALLNEIKHSYLTLTVWHIPQHNSGSFSGNWIRRC